MFKTVKFRLKFQHTAARRRLVVHFLNLLHYHQFQHTAARRRLVTTATTASSFTAFQHTAARRRLEKKPNKISL